MHIRNALPWFTVSMIGFLAVALLPDPLRAAVFAPQTFALDNGLQVVVIENHRVPAVTHMVWYKVGSADEPQGLSGIAHLLEHLMFKGTATRPGGEFSAIVARHGGQENAFTSYDYTGYFQTIAKDRLEQVMALEADRMRNLALSDLDLETERLVVLEERRQRVDNEPGALLDEHVDAALFLNHPYRRPVIGWEHEIRSLQREQLLAFYHQWYRPENAVLVIAGDVTANEVRPLAERIYGGIEAGEAVERAILTEPRQQAARRVTLRDTKVRQPYWERVYLAPSYVSGAREHAYALQVLSHILGESATSRLHRKLVVEDQVAVWVHSHYDPTARGPAQFVVSASPTPGTAMGELERRIEALINETIVAVPASEEIEVAKGRLRADAIYSRDSLSTGARIVGEAIAVGLSVDDVERWPERIAEVTLEAVRLAAGVVFDERRSVTALLLPSSEDSAWAQ